MRCRRAPYQGCHSAFANRLALYVRGTCARKLLRVHETLTKTILFQQQLLDIDTCAQLPPMYNNTCDSLALVFDMNSSDFTTPSVNFGCCSCNHAQIISVGSEMNRLKLSHDSSRSATHTHTRHGIILIAYTMCADNNQNFGAMANTVRPPRVTTASSLCHDHNLALITGSLCWHAQWTRANMRIYSTIAVHMRSVILYDVKRIRA